MVNHLKEILLSLAEEKVRFVVCGGVALVLQGAERMTLDMMKHKPVIDAKNNTSKDFRTLLRSLPDTAFDGHTEFGILSPEQRLLWLSQAIRFYFENRKNPNLRD